MRMGRRNERMVEPEGDLLEADRGVVQTETRHRPCRNVSICRNWHSDFVAKYLNRRMLVTESMSETSCLGDELSRLEVAGEAHDYCVFRPALDDNNSVPVVGE